MTQAYCCVVIPDFQVNGPLPPRVHWASWDKIESRFEGTHWRQRLLTGLRAALEKLRNAGCRTAYIDGSFVTDKEVPRDYDACWEVDGVDPALLDPVLLTFDRGRATQKARYMGEMFMASHDATPAGRSFFEFFQIHKNTGEPKGITAIDLGGLT